MSRFMRGCVLVVLSCGVAGCGGKARVHPVEGRVVVAGRPAANALVAFHPLAATPGVLPVATTGADGGFRLTTRVAGDGAPAGEYAVTVVWPDDSLARDECAEPVAHDRLGGRYADAARTPLRATVRPGDNEVNMRVAVAGSWSLPRLRE